MICRPCLESMNNHFRCSDKSATIDVKPEISMDNSTLNSTNEPASLTTTAASDGKKGDETKGTDRKALDTSAPLSKSGSLDEDDLDPVPGSTSSGLKHKPRSSQDDVGDGENKPKSVTPQRKDELLLQARSDRLQWIQTVPLPYQTKESSSSSSATSSPSSDTTNTLFSRFVHYSHATQKLPVAISVVQYLYGNDTPAAAEALLQRLATPTDATTIGGGAVENCETALAIAAAAAKENNFVYLTGNQILETEIANTQDAEIAAILQNYRSFLVHLQDAECAVLVQGMRTFVRNYPDIKDVETATARLKNYVAASFETIRHHSVFQNYPDDDSIQLRRAVESFHFGQCRSHLERLLWNSDTTSAKSKDTALQDKLLVLQFITPFHLDIHCLSSSFVSQGDTNDDDDDDDDNKNSAWRNTLSEAVSALQSMDSFHSAFEKLQRVLSMYRSVSAALTVALQQNPDTRDKLPSADDVLPTVILTVLMARPERLLFNLQFVEELCPPEYLRGEAGYAFANLYGAYQFLLDLDLDQEPTSLSIDANVYRTAIETHRQEIEKRTRRLNESKIIATKLEETENDLDGLDMFPSPLDIRLARLRGEQIDVNWALQWQESKRLSKSDSLQSPKYIALHNSSIELAEQGLPAGFRRNYTFLSTRPEDVRIYDVPQLLEEYRMLVHTTENLLGERVSRSAAERKAAARAMEKELLKAAQDLEQESMLQSGTF